jgi:peptide-methionine (R)-S-oxide reductase
MSRFCELKTSVSVQTESTLEVLKMTKRPTIVAALLLAALVSQTGAFHTTPSRTGALSNRKKTMCFSKGDEAGDKEGVDVQTWNPLRLAVLRLGFTELAWTSPLNYGKKDGKFSCAYCGHELVDSDSKYDSGSGWPSFWRSIDDGAMSYKMENNGSLECRCGKCTSHLGHVFLDGPRPSDVPQDLLSSSPPSDPRSKRDNARLPRYCLNGAALRLNERQ